MNFLDADRDLTRNSYYAATAPRELRFPSLQDDVQADVAIVGGGLAGLSAAIELADRGLSVVLLEAKELAWGASGRNGGQAIHGLACDQSVIERQLGLDEARRIWAMSIEALDLIRERCKRFAIDCDWQDGFLGVAVSERKGRELQAWVQHMEKCYGYDTRWIAADQIRSWIDSPRYRCGLHDARSGHLHPLKYSLGLAKAAASLGVRIHEQSPVTSLQHGAVATLRCPQGTVRARQVLLAGNVYLQGLAPQIESRIMPVGTYIVCSEPLSKALADSLIPSRSAVCDNNFVLDYFRFTADNRLLFGGGVSYSGMTPAHVGERMRQRMVRAFPQLQQVKTEYAWGGFVDISMNRAPDFGRLTPDGPQGGNVYYLQGFSGHGLALTGMAGKLVAEAMVGDAARFDTFARLKHRKFPGGRWLRTPALVLGMSYYRLKDML
ncbi:MAG TPA: FAD-binding oxidoreductase [Rhizobacter sp.]|nr:FAD-binding oxidoreductase [Rhizobacter sp.]